ncbi:MAG: hypothetical protein IKX88_07260 [Thermoguttaceae bacterium]|nr:hypothetical protein [Thermoguttaceae bacterium]
MFRLSYLFKSRSHSPKVEQRRELALGPIEGRRFPSVTRRAIKTLRFGDLVLAADQLAPKSAPTSAKLVHCPM